MAANFSMSGMPSSSERTCAGWVRYAQYPSRSSTTYTAPYSNSPPSSGPTTYDFTAGLADPAWRSSSTAARSCSLLRPALKVMRLMWKIMVFSLFCCDGEAPGARGAIDLSCGSLARRGCPRGLRGTTAAISGPRGMGLVEGAWQHRATQGDRGLPRDRSRRSRHDPGLERCAAHRGHRGPALARLRRA